MTDQWTRWRLLIKAVMVMQRAHGKPVRLEYRECVYAGIMPAGAARETLLDQQCMGV